MVKLGCPQRRGGARGLREEGMNWWASLTIGGSTRESHFFMQELHGFRAVSPAIDID